MSNAGAQHQKSGKASFEDIYDLEDPRGYYESLGEFGYEIPDHGCRVFSTLIEELRGDDKQSVDILDVCCSYGINAALLKHEVVMDDLYARYGSGEVANLSSEELVESDAEFYANCKRDDVPRVVGLDVADRAVSYAVRSGLLDAGFVENLEGDEEPTDELKQAVAGTDLLTITGGVGYISDRTFDRLLNGVNGSVPWVASFALRWVTYDKYADLLERYGLVTEKLEGHTFPQRRFTGDEERDYVLEELTKMGIDPSGKEAEGLYHADFYLSRPAQEVEEKPVGELLEAIIQGR
ncbi:MAG: hypothetical protein ACR2KW_01230 [Rubrobacter sp.]